MAIKEWGRTNKVKTDNKTDKADAADVQLVLPDPVIAVANKAPRRSEKAKHDMCEVIGGIFGVWAANPADAAEVLERCLASFQKVVKS